MKPLREILDRHDVPALGGVVVRGGDVAFLDVAGVRRRGRLARVHGDDPWHIGSNTKAMTAMMLADLVATGQARWTQRLLDHFPELRTSRDQGSPPIGAVLSHRAGLDDDRSFGGGWAERAIRDPRPLLIQRLSLVESALADWRPRRPPRFRYANVGYVIAGAVIERLTGSVWESAIERMLFGPLGLRRAGFGPPRPRAPWGHGEDGSSVKPGRGADNPAAMAPSGTVHLSLEDYARVLVQMLGAQDHALSCILDPPLGMRTGYRLGWRFVRHRAWAAGPVLAHEGSNTLWHCAALLAPNRGVGVATVCNQGGPDGAKATRELAMALIADLLG